MHSFLRLLRDYAHFTTLQLLSYQLLSYRIRHFEGWFKKHMTGHPPGSHPENWAHPSPIPEKTRTSPIHTCKRCERLQTQDFRMFSLRLSSKLLEGKIYCSLNGSRQAYKLATVAGRERDQNLGILMLYTNWAERHFCSFTNENFKMRSPKMPSRSSEDAKKNLKRHQTYGLEKQSS